MTKQGKVTTRRKLSRRKLLKGGVGVGFLGLGMATLGIPRFASPVHAAFLQQEVESPYYLKPEGGKLHKVAPVSRVKEDPKRFRVKTTKRKVAVYAFKEKDEKGKTRYHILSSICTHQGCLVSWQKSNNFYHCPCHGARYNKYGKVIRPPAPKPLQRFEAVVKDDTLYMKL